MVRLAQLTNRELFGGAGTLVVRFVVLVPSLSLWQCWSARCPVGGAGSLVVRVVVMVSPYPFDGVGPFVVRLVMLVPSLSV